MPLFLDTIKFKNSSNEDVEVYSPENPPILYLHTFTCSIDTGNMYDPSSPVFGFYSIHKDLTTALAANKINYSTVSTITQYQIPFITITPGTYPGTKYIPLTGALTSIDIAAGTCSGFTIYLNSDNVPTFKSISKLPYTYRLAPQ